jgi:two-component system OmpR family sensor kinase
MLGLGLCLSVGIGTLIALRHSLIRQVDVALTDAQSRSTTFFELGPPPFVRFAGPGPIFLDGPGQSAGTVGAVVTDDRVTEAAVIETSGDRQALTPAAVAQLANVATGHVVSVRLDGLGEYRLVAGRTDGRSELVVTGLPLAGVNDTLKSAAWIIGGFSLAALALAVSAGIIVIRRELSPLNRMSLAAQHVAGLPLHEGEVRLPTPLEPIDPMTSHTEVGRLGIAFNHMVDRVAEALTVRHASETRVRQFVADASHELRTPLASIQGYTEVARRLVNGVADEHANGDRDDLVYSLGRVHAESRRMSQLVEDMLLLARLDEGRPLDREEVDVSRLIVDAVSDAHISGREHRWPLDIPDEPLFVLGDRLRLQQALGNLLSNARIHTSAGTRIVTSLRPGSDGSVIITVNDDGPGIPDNLLSEIFERFARGDGSRSRTAGSTGLGLAITRAVIIAHGGTIDVASRPGSTSFTMRLPRFVDVSELLSEGESPLQLSDR